MEEDASGPTVVSLAWALDEASIGFASQPAAMVRRELAAACEWYDCRLDADALDSFAGLITASERAEIDPGTIGVSPGEPYPF